MPAIVFDGELGTRALLGKNPGTITSRIFEAASGTGSVAASCPMIQGLLVALVEGPRVLQK
jgi:hypothetical protein